MNKHKISACPEVYTRMGCPWVPDIESVHHQKGKDYVMRTSYLSCTKPMAFRTYCVNHTEWGTSYVEFLDIREPDDASNSGIVDIRVDIAPHLPSVGDMHSRARQSKPSDTHRTLFLRVWINRNFQISRMLNLTREMPPMGDTNVVAFSRALRQTVAARAHVFVNDARLLKLNSVL